MKFLFDRYSILRNEAGEGGDGGGGEGGDGGSLMGGDGQSFTPQSGGDEYSFTQLLGEDGSFVEGFAEKLPENLRDKADHFSKFKTPEQIMESNYNLQQLLGKKSEAVVIPKEGDPQEVWDTYRAKLGIPTDPSGYGIEKPETLPEGVEWDEEDIGKFTELAHEMGLTPQQAQKLVEFDLSRNEALVGEIRQGVQDRMEQNFMQEKQSLESKWGDQFEANLVKAEKGAKLLGYSREDMLENPLFGSSEFVDAMRKVGDLIGEDKMISGNVPSASSPKGQASDIINNESNPYHKRYWNGDQEVVDMVRNMMQS